ncbi:MAG: hypothetical protein MZV64_61445 [Ignavibacteriales bacterium]|nr:hypothetical protein [Ignavibacteriales bacterium]
MDKSVAPQQFQEKAFFEYHIYNLQRPATIAQSETKQISLFEAGDVKATKSFITEAAVISHTIMAIRQIQIKLL